MEHPKTKYSSHIGKPKQIAYPGLTKDMDVKPDHGEKSYQGHGRLKNRRAIITGGDSGIGRAIAIAYAREGADILISCYNEEVDDANETAKIVHESGQICIIELGDIRSEEKCKQIVERAVKDLGGVDILVNNAGIQIVRESILELTSEEFDRTMKTNVYAPFWLCKAAVAHMKPGSCIINTSSIQGAEPSSHLLDYSMTKGAMFNLTKSLGRQLIDKGIRVNSVAPGPIWTPFIPATMSEAQIARFGQQSPTQRPGQPAEVAPAYVFLASSESSYVTCEILAVTGGMFVS